MKFRIISNYTEIHTVSTLTEAKKFAVEESNRFDDALIIEAGGVTKYMVRSGRIYSLKPLVGTSGANR